MRPKSPTRIRFIQAGLLWSNRSINHRTKAVAKLSQDVRFRQVPVLGQSRVSAIDWARISCSGGTSETIRHICLGGEDLLNI